MRKINLIVVVATLLFGLVGFAIQSIASTGSINEKFGMPIVVYGESLTAEQKEEVRKLLEVDDPSMVQEYTVTAEDLVTYINGDPGSNLYSSAKIIRKDEGHGLVINIVNAENITEVTNDMYANALLTAGIENALVEVASPVKVSGHSALTGIYKAYNVDGESLDQERMEVANEELSIATNLADKAGLDDEKVSELLTEIKKEIAEQNPATREEVEQIVQEQLNQLNINLSPEDLKLLTDLFEKMRSINIDFGNVRDQLDTIASDIRSKLEEVAGNTGFWNAVSRFFEDLIASIKSIFS